MGTPTRLALLTAPLRDRFGAVYRLEFSSPEAMEQIITRAALILGMRLDRDAAYEMAQRTGGTPCIAHRLLKRVRDWVVVKAGDHSTLRVAREALAWLEIDERGA